MNRTGQYKLVRQTGGRGYYAVVQVEISETTNGPIVEVESRLPVWVRKEYAAAAVSGAHDALQNSGSQLDLSTIYVQVADIQELTVDTCRGSVAYASCYATWQALGVEGENPPQLVRKIVEFSGH